MFDEYNIQSGENIQNYTSKQFLSQCLNSFVKEISTDVHVTMFTSVTVTCLTYVFPYKGMHSPNDLINSIEVQLTVNLI